MPELNNNEIQIHTTEKIDLSKPLPDNDYLEFYTKDNNIKISLNNNCINCGKIVDTMWIDESGTLFCGFKCIVHFYTKELKKEGKI